MIQLYIARGSTQTGETLKALLEKRGIAVNRGEIKGTVSYGIPIEAPQVSALNAKAGHQNKLGELRTLEAAGVRVPRWSRNLNQDRNWLPRRLQHQGGQDIKYTGTPKQMAKAYVRADYFVEIVPSRTEFRVWIYRNAHLATYEKVLAHPAQQYWTTRKGNKIKKFGRSHRNGFAFRLVNPVPERLRDAIEMARKSVEVLGLDFGAVDVLEGTDGRFYVLEVNTAPGVEGDTRQGLNSLADKIANWARKGFKGRKE